MSSRLQGTGCCGNVDAAADDDATMEETSVCQLHLQVRRGVEMTYKGEPWHTKEEEDPILNVIVKPVRINSWTIIKIITFPRSSHISGIIYMTDVSLNNCKAG